MFLLVEFSLYFPISWLFRMGSHWSHWKVQSSLCALAVLNGGRGIFPSLYIPISWPFRMGSHWWHWTVKSSLSALAVLNGGRWDNWEGDNHQFICTGISLYIPISWLFRMGSHWWHWTVKSSLSALVVSNGGRGDNHQFICTDISLYIPISWLFRMCSHWQHWTAKSSLSALAVLNGGEGDNHQFYPGKSGKYELPDI